MPMKVESVNQNGSFFKVEGDLGDLPIVEESDVEDCDEESGKESPTLRASRSIAKIPNGLINGSSSSAPVFGNVQLSNSDNAQFGNNTYFNGPVTIKQIIETTSGVDNASYQKTEAENIATKSCNHSKECITNKRNEIKIWQKWLLSAVCGIVIVIVCTIALVLQQNRGQGSYSANDNHDSSTNELLIAPEHLRIVSRTDWLAQPISEKINPIRLPVPWVIITHTATAPCFQQSSCVLAVRIMQTFHIESKGWSDIAYNFLVGGDGSAYFGRGWDLEGAHSYGYNKYAMGIAFLGTFNTEAPTQHQVDACKKLIKLGVAKNKIAKDYKLLAHRQLQSTLSPGDSVYEIIKTWPHFYNDTDIKAIIPNY